MKAHPLWLALVVLLALMFSVNGQSGRGLAPSNSAENFPGKTWESRAPEQAGMNVEKLAQFANVVGGRGCVARHGCMTFTWGDQARSSDVDAEMLPGQRSMGGAKNITSVGPGYYSFNWWLNTTNRAGDRLFTDAPPDTFVASGHGGKRALVVVPSLDLVACWNDSTIDDHDKSPGNSGTKNNRALKILIEACGAP